jgi:hypothetical protein
MLFALSPSWDRIGTVVYIAISQGFSGIAKDLVKMSGKSVTKLVVKDSREGQSKLFKIVAWLTGSKNGVKVRFLASGDGDVHPLHLTFL